MMRTVLGDIKEDAFGITLPHEHICCFSEYAYQMAGSDYLDKNALARKATVYLKELKKKYGLATVVDCTPVNLGRDVELLKRVSEQSEIHIVCATGFYYTEEPVLYNTTADHLCRYIVSDAQSTNAGIIKCAVENEEASGFQKSSCVLARRRIYTQPFPSYFMPTPIIVMRKRLLKYCFRRG